MNAAPHMFLTGYLSNIFTVGASAAFVIPSKDILITRMSIWDPGIPQGCTGVGTIAIATGSNGLPTTAIYSLNMNSSGTSFFSDSGPLSIAVTGGTPLWLEQTAKLTCNIFGSGPDATVSVEYVMQ